MIIHRTCIKCKTNQMELQYDSGWQLQCLCCSKIINIVIAEDKELIRKYDIESCSIRSPMTVTCYISLTDPLIKSKEDVHTF